MIKFRQRDFSYSTRVAYRFRKGVNDLTSAIKDGLKSSGKIEAMKRGINITPQNSTLPNTNSTYRLKRQAVRDVKMVKSIPTRINDTANKIAVNPGKYTSDTVSFVLENPIASTGIAAGYSIAPIPGTTAASLAIENTAKKIPIYRQATSILKDAYRRSKLPETLELAVNAGVNSAKIM